MDPLLLVVIFIFGIPIFFLIKHLIPYLSTKKGRKKYKKEISIRNIHLIRLGIIWGLFLSFILVILILRRYDLIIEAYKKYPFSFVSFVVLLLVFGFFTYVYAYKSKNKNL